MKYLVNDLSMEYEQTLEEWSRAQPLSILQLDSADRAVLRIAGKLFNRGGGI